MSNTLLKTFYELSGQTNAQSSAEQEFAKLYDKSIPFDHQSNRFIECDIHADKKDLTREHYEVICMYCDMILDFFGEGEAPTRLYNRQAFEKWFASYKRQESMNGRREWDDMPPLY
ncbi:hypothetical protein ASPFODRAFT_210026 [Aspergillus luchuensis CBS 106.47]|uniref:Uncharacterized protein n=1 Tax=Aspergillus luchuensis (strain CBS 106.47) TaxID=1137211 RepID=A0A1M3T8Y6_ASPLC|nr:hypothetical protein ASPFODRAFT_210026 [Aspergillus luchuensis CBS 106.47]